MALITCPDCGKRFSDQAATCPNCGRPHNLKFCKFCGQQIDAACIICPQCGKQVEELNNSPDKNIIINDNISTSTCASTSTPIVYANGRKKNKWISLLLCIFTLCGHKFYEGKIGMGILYFITGGLFGMGWIVDIILLALKPNPYYV